MFSLVVIPTRVLLALITTEGFDAVRARSRALDGAQEAHLIALSCSPSPEGHARWTLRMLADRMVQLE